MWLVTVSALSLLCDSHSFHFNGLPNVPEHCEELNNTFIEEFESLEVTLEEFFDSTPSECNLNPKTPVTEDFFFNTTHLISKRGESSKLYTFKFLILDRTCKGDDWYLTIQFDSCANISSIIPSGTLADLLPMDYHITKYVFPPKIDFYVAEDTDEEVFHIIEGPRCKFSFNNVTGPDGKAVCWDTPSICRGHFRQCIGNDDIDHFCYDDILQEGAKHLTEDIEVHWTELAQAIYWKDHATYYIHEDKTIEFHEPELIEWLCNEFDGKGIDFVCTVDLTNLTCPLYGSLALKTLSGFKG